MFNLPLKYRIAGIIFLLEAMMMAAVLATNYANYSDTLAEQTHEFELVQLDLLSDLSRIALLTSEYYELQLYIESAVNVPSIQEIYLIDIDNRIVVSSSVSMVGKILPALKGDSDSYWKIQNIENVANLIGRFAIKFSHASLDVATEGALNAGIRVAVVGMVIIAFIGVMIGFLLTRRLEKITFAAQQYANGNFDFKTNLEGGDEVAIVSQSIDQMVDRIKLDFNMLQEREATLTNYKDTLEQKILERTQELKVARDIALQTSKAKSIFLANMSHELRTPLNAIIGYGELLGEIIIEKDYLELSADISKIQFAGRHLLALINDILDLSKIEAGKRKINISEFDLSDVVKDIVGMVEPLMQKNNNRFTYHMIDDITSMTSDSIIIHQALLNLLSNAAKFTHEGAIHLKVDSFSQNNMVWLRLSVSDTGIGISTEKISDLFKEFSQVGLSLDRRHGGTGLGLAISQRICRLLGGDITATSELNKGSEFVMTVPLNSESYVAEVETAVSDQRRKMG